MLFESARVKLRKITKDDIELYHKWRNDVEVMHSTSPSLDVYPLKATEDFVEYAILRSDTSKGYMMVDKKSEASIGIVSLINMDYKNRNAECIIDIGEKEYWGKGFGGEGLTLLLDYAFQELNLHRISLRVFSFNDRAIHLYKKLGFELEGKSRQTLFRDGRWHDIIHMGILQEEYFWKKEAE
ncbi:GNAT family N-acetyltransferase [Oceanobacillus neutriphilus]|uniref:Acetyltransferase n=1 Tax=Oceanobacillus neutriphilus TaxID=531815 RepID=A0ABQ2NQP0_9BACI|nr:GNAT family protein [Oceanobacillus neutriphilus]GGP08225.1 acetyltransferase [Oceanobacillus neutriphilus]